MKLNPVISRNSEVTSLELNKTAKEASVSISKGSEILTLSKAAKLAS